MPNTFAVYLNMFLISTKSRDSANWYKKESYAERRTKKFKYMFSFIFSDFATIFIVVYNLSLEF